MIYLIIPICLEIVLIDATELETKPIIGKKTAYIIKIKAVIKISIILPNLGQIGFISGLIIRNKDEVIKKNETI